PTFDIALATNMYRNAYQRGMLTVFFSCGSKPLGIWEIQTKDGYVSRFLDQDIKSMVLEIGGTNVSTTFIRCPKGNQVLGIAMPFLVMIVKNLKKYFSFEVTILDETGMRRRFRVSNFQSTTQIMPMCTCMPIGLSDGWNQIQFNLAEFTRRAYKKQFIEVQKLKINANIRLRRIYFTERLIPEDELPPEYKLYFPLASKGQGKKGVEAAKGKEMQKVSSALTPTIEGPPVEVQSSKAEIIQSKSRASVGVLHPAGKSVGVIIASASAVAPVEETPARGLTSTELGLEEPPARLFLNERLTRLNRLLFAKAREACQHHKWRYCWTKGGRIYLREEEGLPANRMFKNAYQNGLLSIFYSCGANPLELWEVEVKNGHIKRITDSQIRSIVLEICGSNVSTTYITCPKGQKTLGINLPYMVMIVKNLKRPFTFEVTVLDKSGTRRRFRISNFQSTTQILPLCTTMPIKLNNGWNQIQFNLDEFTKRSYKTEFQEVSKLKINANICLRRVYFTETLLTDEQMPPEYRLYYPIVSKKTTKAKPNADEVKETLKPSRLKQTAAKAHAKKGIKVDVGSQVQEKRSVKLETDGVIKSEVTPAELEGPALTEPVTGHVEFQVPEGDNPSEPAQAFEPIPEGETAATAVPTETIVAPEEPLWF
ncbi:Uncharacterized protein OBRU01_05049, partial [Operophtera brumata]